MKYYEHDLVLALAVPVQPAVAGVTALGFKKVQRSPNTVHYLTIVIGESLNLWKMLVFQGLVIKTNGK